MNISEINQRTLYNLYEAYPVSFKNLTMQGHYLVYNDESVDISNFNINDLLSGNNLFSGSLASLSSEDIFRIIRVHALTLSSTKKQEKESNSQKLETIKRENPLMKRISIVTRNNGISTNEYFNIVDSHGNDNLFFNDRNVDLFEIYSDILSKKDINSITPEDIIAATERKLHRIPLIDSKVILEKDVFGENFQNEIRHLHEDHEGEKTIRVLGNELHDIAIVSDSASPDEHKVITYKKGKNGELIAETHNQNVDGSITGEKEEQEIDSSITDQDHEETTIVDKEEDTLAKLIPRQEFYRLLASPFEWSEEERKNVALYYAYFGDLIKYEEFLLPELLEILQEFRNYIISLQVNEEETPLTPHQREASAKLQELEEKKYNDHKVDSEKALEDVQKLKLQLDDSKKGSIIVIQIVIAIVIISILLSILTLIIL